MRLATCQLKRANSMPGGTSTVALYSGFKAQNMAARGLLHRRVLPQCSAIECDRSARKKSCWKECRPVSFEQLQYLIILIIVALGQSQARCFPLYAVFLKCSRVT